MDGNTDRMRTIELVLLIVALVCFLAAALNVPARVGLVALGLAAWVLVPLIAAAEALG